MGSCISSHYSRKVHTTAVLVVVQPRTVHAADHSALRSRLQSFGSSFSIEVSPRDYHGATGKKDGPLTKVWDKIRAGTFVYVNWVAKKDGHGMLVLDACKALTDKRFHPVPHLPVCRFDRDDAFAEILAHIKETASCDTAMVIGGNDCFDRSEAGQVPPRFSSATALLSGTKGSPDTLAQLSDAGIVAVSVGGYPEGHPGLGFDITRTQDLLESKCRVLLSRGFDVHIATQFCFNSANLIKWLRRTREALNRLRTEVDSSPTCGSIPAVHFHIGIPGPTPRSKLERISQICEVPSAFLNSAFDLVDGNGDGYVDEKELEQASAFLGVDLGRMKALAATHDTDGDGRLLPFQFASLLADLSVEESPRTNEPPSPPSPASPSHSGPSALLDVDDKKSAVVDVVAEEVIWPAELIMALAHFCENNDVASDEVRLHLFPFGGIKRAVDMAAALEAGTFPKLM